MQFKDLTDLKRYLETRREMARRKEECPGNGELTHAYSKGVRRAFDESVKAIEEFLTQNHEEER